jgi:HK97 family phage portal protein
MPNPFKAMNDWLHGEDLKAKPVTAPESEVKLYAINDYRAALTSNMLIHGPGATTLLEGAYANDGNSAVYACLEALAMAFFEPPLRVFRGAEHGDHETVLEHPMQALLDNPNPAMSGRELQFWIGWACACDGNAYLVKLRSGDALSGNVVQLWPVSPRLMRPMTIKNSGDFISFYRRELGDGKHEDIPTENVIHFKLGVDDRDHRLGLSNLKRLVREVATDDEATTFSDTLLKNYGIPGLVVTLPESATMKREDAIELQARIQAEYGGNNRGRVGVLAPGAKLEQLGFSPEALSLKALHDFPETRICAVLRVPPAVAYLGVGLEQSANYASLRVIYEAFTERTMIPLWALAGSRWTQSLKPDFTRESGLYLAYDLSEVRALQEDMDARYKRLDLAVQGGWIKKNEARAEVGFEPLPEFDQEEPEPVQQPPALRVVKQLKALKQGGADLERLPELYAALIELAEPGFTEEMREFFQRQKTTIQRRLVSGGA